MPIRLVRLAVVMVAALLGRADPAEALSSSSTLAVAVTVQSGCVITSGSTLNFGTYTSGQASDLTAETNIEYRNCLIGQLTLEFDGGGSGSTLARRLTNGQGDELSYSLFQDAARSSSLGLGVDAKVLNLGESGSGAFAVYGTIPASQLVRPGAYADTVNITMTF